MNETFSVSELSKIAGISIRTLHHYDKINLLKANRCDNNGYRQYNHKHLIRLQQILIYRELDFSLETIAQLLNSEDFDLEDALEKQKVLLKERLQKTQLMISKLENTIHIVNGKKNLDLLFKGIPKDKAEEWKSMMKEQAGEHTFNGTLKLLGNIDKTLIAREQKKLEQWIKDYVPYIRFATDSEPVQEKVRAHYTFMNDFFRLLYGEAFNKIGGVGYRQLADEILSNPVTHDMYEHYHQGTAQHLHEAMKHFAEHHIYR